MTVQEQQKIREKYHSKAMQYMGKAKEYLKEAPKDGKFFCDQKYVKKACREAYKGLLVALDCFLLLKGVETPDVKGRKPIEFYQYNINKLDKKMMNPLNCAYQILHLYANYDGINSVAVVRYGFEDAQVIINKIKPAGLNGATRRNGKVKK